MSRIGMKPIKIPQGVKVTISPSEVAVEGPKGKLRQSYHDEVEIAMKDGAVIVSRKDDSKAVKAFHGLYRNLINNMVLGVSEGFKRVLAINGVGYRAEVQGKFLVLSIGYSNDFSVYIPDGLAVATEANGQKIVVTGCDKAFVGKFVSEVRSLRSPEPYKGKGIKYEEEKIRRKVGKTGVK